MAWKICKIRPWKLKLLHLLRSLKIICLRDVFHVSLLWTKYIPWHFYLCTKYWDDFTLLSKMSKKKKQPSKQWSNLTNKGSIYPILEHGSFVRNSSFSWSRCLWRNKDIYSALRRPMIFQSKEFGSKHQISNHLKSRKVDEINIKTGKILSLMIKQWNKF